MSFCLNTLLTDIATRYPPSKEKIIEAQIKCLSKLSNTIRSAKSDKLNDLTKSTDSNNLRQKNNTILIIFFILASLCKATIPCLIGLARSMGRATLSDPPLLCRLFPKPTPPVRQIPIPVPDLNIAKKKSFSNFR